jgi:hypothetical protein
MEENQKVQYNQYEDLKFPISLVRKSLWILKNRGSREFWDYVRDIEMPSQDIERILNKHKYATDPEFKAQIDKIVSKIKDKLDGSNISFPF